METVLSVKRSAAVPAIRVCRGEVLAALSRILDYNLSGEVSHHARVAVLAKRIASVIRRADRLDTFYAGLVHDIGLAGQPRDCSHAWDLEEQPNITVTRFHPLVGAQMIAAVPELMGVAETILDHHEWVNGHGYPRGKGRDEIAPAAQALRFADTCDLVLREQAWSELIAFTHAIRGRTADQVEPFVADAGIEILGDTGFYAQLIETDDVQVLLSGALHRVAAEDFATAEGEVTGLLELLGHVADAYHTDRTGHSRRVAGLSVLISMAAGLEAEETTKVKWAALVHDVGMVAVPRALLDKSAALTPEELDVVRSHIDKTAEFLGAIHGLEEVATIAACHGEAFDGSGHPKGLAGAEIPLGARIIAVCDTFDALTSPRPYREARDTSLAIDILVKESGSLFDPDIVAVAVPALLIARSAEEVKAAGV